MKIVYLFLFFMSVIAHAGPRIIGDNDLLPVTSNLTKIPSQFKSLLPAIGKLSVGCTVTHIGQGFVITAGHCFWQTFFGPELMLNQHCTDEVVTWPNGKTSKCTQIIAMQRNEDSDQDFAIMKIANPPKAVIKIDWDTNILPGKTLTMFSYPKEEPLSWSQYCPLKAIASTAVHPKRMHYVCDTEEGSSGAAVIDTQTGKIVGLHISGEGEFNDDGTARTAMENFGIYIKQTPLKTLLKRNGFLF